MDAEKDGNGIAAFSDAGIKVFLKEHKKYCNQNSGAKYNSSILYSIVESRLCVVLLTIVVPVAKDFPRNFYRENKWRPNRKQI